MVSKHVRYSLRRQFFSVLTATELNKGFWSGQAAVVQYTVMYHLPDDGDGAGLGNVTSYKFLEAAVRLRNLYRANLLVTSCVGTVV
jgi:hypothetical protein